MRLVVYMSIVGLLAIPLPGETPQKAAGGAKQVESNTAQKNKPPAPAQPTIDPQQPDRNQGHGSNVASKNEQQDVRISELPPISTAKDMADWAYWGFSLLLVIVAGVQAYLMFKTMKVAKDAADAALLNARAIINSERPWIIPRMERKVVDQWIDGKQDSFGQPITEPQTQFTFSIRNDGRTPAHIISVVANFVFTPRGGDLPAVPDYGTEPAFEQQRILSQKDSPMSLEPWVFRVPWVLGPRGLWDDVVATPTQWWWRYGRIRYSNVLDGKEHETCFCWLYMPHLDDFITAGPSDYTNYT